MSDRNLLGEFLRARRQATTADEVGLVPGGRRRTPGLRREEVARLASVSPDYYIRLEQGRERHPSDQVLNALARVFQLDLAATEHLYELARPRTWKRTPARRVDQIHPNVVRLIERWEQMPALVVNYRSDILATNLMADSLFADWKHPDNLLRQIFLDPAAHEFYLDWEEQAWSKVADLRAAAGADLDDAFLLDLIEELSHASEEFRRMWARHDVQVHTHRLLRLHHRDIGDLTLWHEAFHLASAPGLRLFVAHAEPGSPSEEALARLRGTSNPAFYD